MCNVLQGKGGEPVFLFVDGHASRWSLAALNHLLSHNVFCICLPSHTSIWAQPNDAGPNASFKWVVGTVATEEGLAINVHKSDADFNQCVPARPAHFALPTAALS